MGKSKKVTLAEAQKVQCHLIHNLRMHPETHDAGVGLSRNESGFVVKVHLSTPLPEGFRIPSQVQGVPVLTEYVGQAYAY
jgi:hypothetical protein